MAGFSRLVILFFWVWSRIRNPAYRMLNRKPLPWPTRVGEVLEAGSSPLNLARLLIGRVDRAKALEDYFQRKGVRYQSERFERSGRKGVNYIVNVGDGPKTLILIAHHDAIPGSPGANDNASSVAVLLSLLERIRVPESLRVRFLFPDHEENGMVGSQEYVERHPPTKDVIGVLSLELCGIGNAVVIVDVTKPTEFLDKASRGLEKMGLELEKTYFLVEPIPLQSDHRSFRGFDLPTYCFAVMPNHEANLLRDYVKHPLKGMVRMISSGAPKPFDTYHRSTDTFESLEASALDLAVLALQAIIAALR